MSAEGMRNRSDDADFADAVVEGVAARGFAALRGQCRAAGMKFAMLLKDLIERDDDVRRPDAIFFQRHEFDEADHDAFFAGEARRSHDLIFIEAAQQNAIDFHRFQTDAFGGANAREHSS